MGARGREGARNGRNALPYTLEWAPFPVKDVVTGHDTYDFYDNKRISFSPNYNDPKVQEKLLRFVAALGDRYDGDPRIGFITAGLYGFWGEEHTYPYNGAVSSQNPAGINWMPSEEFRAQLVEAWDDAFDETFIQNRYPIEATTAHGMGYYDDSFGYATLEGTSWHFIPKLKKQGEGDAWQHSPIGGELYPSFQECAFSEPLRCPNMEAGRDYKALESIQQAHATWITNNKAFTVGYSGGELTRAKAASAAMGYTLQATRTSVTYNQVKATVVVEIKNTGVAPFYATWPLEVILIDENNEIVTSQTIESILPSILPGQTGRVTARLPLPAGYLSKDSAQELTAAFRVVNPLPGGARRLRERGHEQATARIPGPGEADPGPRAEELTTRPGSHTRGPGLSLLTLSVGSTSRGSAGSYRGVSGTGLWLHRERIRPTRGMCRSCQRRFPPVGRCRRRTARSPRGSGWSRLPYPRGD